MSIPSHHNLHDHDQLPIMIVHLTPVVDAADLSIHTWYMTKGNYEDMNAGRLTDVFVPLFHKSSYNLTIVGSLFFFNKFLHCNIHSPRDQDTPQLTFHRKSVQLEYGFPALLQNSGVYNLTCRVMYKDNIKGDISQKTLSKSLRIIFFKGILWTL